jgi:hypothetical protein
MKIHALTLFVRCHSNFGPINSWNIAALHWKGSITWRWIINWTPYQKQLKIIYVKPKHKVVYISIPIIGKLSFIWQDNMWKEPNK